MKKLLTAALLLLSSVVMAQENWSITFRPTLHIATNNVYHQSWRLGNGVSFTGEYKISRTVMLYAGVTWNRFDTDENFDEENIALTQRGLLTGGMYFFKLMPQQNSSFYARAGISYTYLKSESRDNAFNVSTPWALGTQVGLGWKLEPSKNWFVMPELQYAHTKNPYSLDGVQQDLRLSYISITVGIMHAF